MDRDDVRMVQSGSRAGLALETVQKIGVLGDRRGEDLDRELAVEPGSRAL